MFALFANIKAHGTSILSYDGIRTLQCHYFPLAGPAGQNLCSRQLYSMILVFIHLYREI